MTPDELFVTKIATIDSFLYEKIRHNWDKIAKPLESLGDFELIAAKIGAINHDESIDLDKKALVIMCADNGVIEENVSQSGSDVTESVTRLMGKRESSVCKMSGNFVDIFPIDIGVRDASNMEGVADLKVAFGTRNFAKEQAMTLEETLQAIECGINTIARLKEEGYKIVATGEMGIGNTTTSSTLLSALLKIDAKSIVGRGAGLTDAGLERKLQIIEMAIRKYDLYNADALTCLKSVGGLDIAGLCGCFIGAAIYEMPIVIDGLISVTAALCADRLIPGVRDFCIASHSGKERGIERALFALGLNPVIGGNMALGEGSGAVMLFPLLEMVLALYKAGVRFEDTEIEQYKRL